MIFARRRISDRLPSPPLPRVVARGARTVVREFTAADMHRWAAWPVHTDLLFESYNPPRMTRTELEAAFAQKQYSADHRQYAVDDGNGELVGRITLREIDWHCATSVLGVSFRADRLGQGLGSDALAAFLGFYFGPLRMRSLYLDVAAFNVRAQRVYERCGFRRCGQRWGEPQADRAGVFRQPEYDGIRCLFCREHSLIRPLVYDMVLRRDDWLRRQDAQSRSGR